MCVIFLWGEIKPLFQPYIAPPLDNYDCDYKHIKITNINTKKEREASWFNTTLKPYTKDVLEEIFHRCKILFSICCCRALYDSIATVVCCKLFALVVVYVLMLCLEKIGRSIDPKQLFGCIKALPRRGS